MKKIIVVLIILLMGGAIFLFKKDKEFVATKDAQKTFGEGIEAGREFIPLDEWGKRETSKREVKNEDFAVSSEILFEDTEFLSKGNITVNKGGRLIFKNSEVKLTPANRFQKSVISVKDNGEIIFENSTLKPQIQDPAKLEIFLYDSSKLVFKSSQGINTIYAFDKSDVQIEDSIWAFYLPFFRAGGINVSDSANVFIENSVIGGLTLNLPENASAEVNNFKPKRFSELDVIKEFAIKNTDFKVILKDSEILGDYFEGDSERGLGILAPVKVNSLKISDSILNRMIFDSSETDLEFSNLDLDSQVSISYRNINISNSRIMSQWGFLTNGGSLNILNSKGLSLGVRGNAKIYLENSQTNGFVAQNFTGSLELSNVIWKYKADILNMSNFTVRGSVSFQGFDGQDFYPLNIVSSGAEREFPLEVLPFGKIEESRSKVQVMVFDKNNKLISETVTDEKGRANFQIEFSDINFRDKFLLKIAKEGKEKTYPINFITPTPVKLILE